MSDFDSFFEEPDGPVWVQNHWHSEPVCAHPDCRTYLTPGQMARALRPGHVCGVCFTEISVSGACLCDD